MFGCPHSVEVQAAQAKLAFAAVLLQVWAHPVLCYHKSVREATHPDYPLGGHAPGFSADVLKGQRQQRVTSQDGNIFSIHLHMQCSHGWPIQGCLNPALQSLILRMQIYFAGLRLVDA